MNIVDIQSHLYQSIALISIKHNTTMPVIPKDRSFEGEMRCLSSGVETVYKRSRGTPATRVRSTLARPCERCYISKWKKRKDRKRDYDKYGGERFTCKGKVWDE